VITPSLFPPADPLQLQGPRLELRLPARWIFRLPRALHSPNRFVWRTRWALAAERQAWTRELETAMASFATVNAALGWTAAERQAYGQLRGAREKRAVRIWRLVPSARHFFRDIDNLDFCAKHLVDALVRTGLLRNDNRTWLERARTQEVVADDRGWWTVVQLDRPDVRGAWRS
jgi:Holliday junction resolvase RusA-like endonuclease